MRVKTGNRASLAASHATTKAPRKLFFNLRGMRSGEYALTPDDSESESTSLASYLQADKQMRKVIEN